jgi:hypothetical protein
MSSRQKIIANLENQRLIDLIAPVLYSDEGPIFARDAQLRTPGPFRPERFRQILIRTN